MTTWYDTTSVSNSEQFIGGTGGGDYWLRGEHFTSTSAAIGKSIGTLKLYTKNSSSGTGTITAGIFNSSGVLQTTLGTLDYSTVPSTAGLVDIPISTPYTIQSGDYLGFYKAGGSDASVYATDSNAYDGTNTVRFYGLAGGSGALADSTTSDFVMTISSATPSGDSTVTIPPPIAMVRI